MKRKYFYPGNSSHNLFITLITIFIILISLMIAPITAQELGTFENTRNREVEPNQSTFNATRIFHDSSALSGGIDFGDANNDGTTELVVVGWSNRATMLSYNESSMDWDKILIWEDTCELMDVAISDIDDSNQGNELVVGGYSNNLTSLTWNKNTKLWETKTLWTSPYHIFGLAAGDIDPDYDGNEIAVVDWKSPTITIVSYSNDNWINVTLDVAEPLTNVEIGDLDPSHPGVELIAVGSNGSVLFIFKENNVWNITTIWQDTIGLFNAEITEFDEDHSGKELLVVGRSKNATELYPDPANDGAWIVKTLWHAPGGLEGLAIGDFNSFYDGSEIAIGGYSNTATMLGRNDDENEWTSIIMWNEHDPQETELNGVMVADFYPEHESNEVAVVGYSGKVTMLIYEEPDFKLSSPTYTKTIAPGDYTTFSIVVDPISDFNFEVGLAIQNPPLTEGLSYNFSQLNILPPDRSVITIQTEPSTLGDTYIITIVGTSRSAPKQTHTLELNLIIESDTTPDFELEVIPFSNTISFTPDGHNTISYEIYIEPINDLDSKLILNISGQPATVVITVEPPLIDPTSEIRTSTLTIKINENTPAENFTIFVSALASDGSISHKTRIYLNVESTTPSPLANGSSDEDFDKLVIASTIIIVILIIIILFAILYKSKRKEDVKPKK